MVNLRGCAARGWARKRSGATGGECGRPVRSRVTVANSAVPANLGLEAQENNDALNFSEKGIESFCASVAFAAYRAPTGRGSEEEVGDEPPCVSLLVCV